jgi:hypothetical protein
VLPVALLALVTGILGGLARLGIAVGAPAAALAGWHGVLMVPVFFGTVIGLERAVALGGAVGYAVPAATAAAGLAMLAGAPALWAQSLLVAAAALFLGLHLALLRRTPVLYLAVMALGAGCLLAGNCVWAASGGTAYAVMWWLAFLLLTIAAERLELTRVRPQTAAAVRSLVGIAALLVAAALLAAREAQWGSRLFAGAELALAIWLIAFDIARRNLRAAGLTRYIGACLLLGYGWLALGGLLGMQGDLDAGAGGRDAAVHAVTLGFVFGMVFGHAPVVLPAVARLTVRYRPALYVPVGLLQFALALRVAAALQGWRGLQQAAATGTALALLAFAGVLAFLCRPVER